MSDTDDTDVLVLIPHDFFTVSSSDDEHLAPPTVHRRFYSPSLKVMSENQEQTPPKKPSTLHDLPSPYKLGDNFPKHTQESYRSPSKPEYTPQKSFRYSPSKGHHFKPSSEYTSSESQDNNLPQNNYLTSPRYSSADQTKGAIPKSGILTTYDSASPSARFRRSTSDLPNLSEQRQDINQSVNTNGGQRQRSLTGEILLSGLQVNEPSTQVQGVSNNTTQSQVRNNDQVHQNEHGNNGVNPPNNYVNPENPDGLNKPFPIPAENKEDPKSVPYTGTRVESPHVCGDNIGSIPDLGFGIREFLASLKPSVPQSSNTGNYQTSQTPRNAVHEEPCTKRYFSPLGGEATPSGLSGSRRQLNFDEHHHEGGPSSLGPHGDMRNEKPNIGYVKRPSAFVPVGPGSDSVPRVIGEPSSLPIDLNRGEIGGSSVARSPSVALPSLSQLWRDDREANLNPHHGVQPALLAQKLEEEKYRRLHCEQLISDLQQKLLRETERVAVATQIDSRKDDYLGKLRERYEGTARHWHDEREHLLQDIAEKNEMCSATIQRLRGCERELSKALDLASGFQQRSLSLEREKTEAEAALRARVIGLERQCSQQEQEILKLRAAAQISEQHDNKRGDQMAALQNMLEDTSRDGQWLERQGRRDLEAENKRLAQEISEKEANALTLEAERDTQQAKLRDMKQRADMLEQQKIGLQQALEELKKKERQSRQEVRELSQAMDQSRQTLKEQYQGQLDQVVRGKLAEFQAQLDGAEAAIRQQWEAREADARTKHARSLSDAEQRYLGELRQVEERHSRDIAWWQRSLAQAMEQVQELTSELERQEKHREQLAGKIRSMLQAQYQQAANLIWEPPNTNGSVQGGSKASSAADFKGWGSLPSMGHMAAAAKHHQAPPTAASSENQISEAGKPQHEQLKRYIEMLLQRPIGDPLLQDQNDGHSQNMPKKSENNNQAPFIPELDLSKLSLPDNKPKSSKDNQKPPWK